MDPMQTQGFIVNVIHASQETRSSCGGSIRGGNMAGINVLCNSREDSTQFVQSVQTVSRLIDNFSYLVGLIQ